MSKRKIVNTAYKILDILNIRIFLQGVFIKKAIKEINEIKA